MITKICTKCGEEKDIKSFKKHKGRKDGIDSWCKECHNKQSNDRYFKLKNNTEFITKRRVIRANHYKNNRIHENNTNKDWYKNNPERAKIIINRRLHKRKRNFGYVPLNEKFEGSVGHHISKDLVIFIPEELHKSISHRYDDPISMGEINGLALEFMMPEVG